MPNFVRDVEEIRQRAIQKIEEGAVTSTYGVDKDKAISILNEALATEIVCVLRYQHHYFMATGVHGKAAAEEFKEHADAEREHADKLAERIQQLGGKPDFNPRSLLERSVSQYIEGESLADMIREDLIAERVVIDVYREMIKFFGDGDPTTRILIEELLEDEEEHASDLSDLLYVVNPSTGQTEVQDPGTQIGKNDREAKMDRGAQNGGRRNQPSSEESRRAMQQERQSGREQANNDAEEAHEALGNVTQELSRGGNQHQRQEATNVTPMRGNRGNERGQQSSKAQAGRGKQEASRAQVSRGGTSLDGPAFESNERGGRRDRSEARPARSTGQERPGAGRRDVAPEHAPGTTGRVMARRGRNEVAPADDDVPIGGQTGTNRSAKVTNKNRKNRAA
jgi:bacterioferritin